MNNNLIIGLGGTGGLVLKELRKRIYDEFDEIPEGIGFMYVDSSRELMRHDDPTWLTPDGQHDAQFSGREFLDISVKSQSDPLAALPTYFPNLKGIIENCERLKNYQPDAGAMQDRRLGRVLLGIHATEFDRLFRDRVLNLHNQKCSSDLNITIVTGLSGGTGSGCVISVIAYILRLYPDAIFTVMATLPTIPPPPMYNKGRYLANAYAALRELNALNIGKLKLTDLVTGEKFQPELPYDRSLDFCHRLQENKLFRLFLFDSFHSEYDKTANILYHNMWLGAGDGAVETYKRNLEMYATIPAPEFDASTVEGDYIEARTRAVGALGLYRIIYPRKPILRHVAYQVAAQSYSQMFFNNYVEGLGYVDKPAHIGCTITDRELELWRMAPAYLRLDRDILPQRQRYRTFRDEWEIVGDRALEEAIFHDNPLEFMEKLFKDYFGKQFRQNGVEEYFQHEANSNDYVGIIASDYETRQLQSWRAGEKGICHLAELLDELIETLQGRIDRLPEEMELCTKEVQECQNTLNQIRAEYHNSLFARLLNKKRYIYRQKDCLVNYYYHRTLVSALDFERRLSEALVIRLRSLQSNLDHLAHYMKEEISRIHDLAQKEKEPPTDTFYAVDWNWVQWYEDTLSGNRVEIQRMANVIRMRYAEASQSMIMRLIDLFRFSQGVRNIFPVCMELVKAYDAKLFFGDKLDKNILSIIEAQHPTEEWLSQNLRQVLEKANEHISFNDCEKMKVVRNNPLPNDPWQRPHETILVRIPHATNEREKLTSERLAALFKANCGFTNVIIDTEAPETQEISIASIHTNFPLRCVKSLPDLKQQYDDLISNIGTQAANMLHTEDAFENLPSLEIEAYTEQQPSQKEEVTDNWEVPLPPPIPQEPEDFVANNYCLHNNNLIIGLGGTGGRVLKELKKLSSGNLLKNCGIEFLYIDSASDYSRDFDYQEFYNISTDIRKTADYNGILSSKFDSGQTDSSVIWNNIRPIVEGCQWMEYWVGSQGTKQNRRAGRMMFGAHLMDLDRYLYNRIHRLYESTGISPDIDLNVFIISHLSGGTGSGSLIDMIMLIKSYHRNARINIIGVLPTVPPPIGHDTGRYLANAYATLMELTALNKGEFTPIDITSGVRHDRSFLGDSQTNLFSTILFNTEQIADTLYHLLTLSDSNQTLPFIKEIENQPFASLGFSKITHPLEEFERNFSYDGSAERAIWRSIYRDAECKLVVEEAEYMRLICVPYSLDERESLVNAVKFMNNILWHNPDLLIDNSKSNRDEIAMLSLCCDFRPQNLSIMPELKKQYDQLMYADKTKAISMLHIENECSELPSLLNDKNEESKLPYILLAMAMEVLCQDWDLEGNKIWAYKTIGFLPDGTPAKGTFYNRLTWLDPSHEFIYGYEMPTHLFNYIKRDVENLIEKNKDNADWIERTLKSIDAIASKIERTIGVTEAKKSKIEACDILNYGKKVIKCRLE